MYFLVASNIKTGGLSMGKLLSTTRSLFAFIVYMFSDHSDMVDASSYYSSLTRSEVFAVSGPFMKAFFSNRRTKPGLLRKAKKGPPSSLLSLHSSVKGSSSFRTCLSCSSHYLKLEVFDFIKFIMWCSYNSDRSFSVKRL